MHATVIRADLSATAISELTAAKSIPELDRPDLPLRAGAAQLTLIMAWPAGTSEIGRRSASHEKDGQPERLVGLGGDPAARGGHIHPVGRRVGRPFPDRCTTRPRRGQ